MATFLFRFRQLKVPGSRIILETLGGGGVGCPFCISAVLSEKITEGFKEAKPFKLVQCFTRCFATSNYQEPGVIIITFRFTDEETEAERGGL